MYLRVVDKLLIEICTGNLLGKIWSVVDVHYVWAYSLLKHPHWRFFVSFYPINSLIKKYKRSLLKYGKQVAL